MHGVCVVVERERIWVGLDWHGIGIRSVVERKGRVLRAWWWKWNKNIEWSPDPMLYSIWCGGGRASENIYHTRSVLG